MTERLFVYGTLMPDHEAWSVVAPFATATQPCVVSGRLFDTGAGYPAAVFDADAPPIRGVAITLRAHDVAAALASLDRFEGPEYRRIVVHDADGPLFAYEWIADRTILIEVPSGSWTAPS